ncbi:hypothetical protein DFH08DRAFT_720339, partial [Mycena albidolilacea]
HFLTQIPQPIHRNSEMKAILSVDLTSIQSLPGENPIKMMVFERTFLHSWAHRLGLHLFASTMAIRVILSAMARRLWVPSFGQVKVIKFLIESKRYRQRPSKSASPNRRAQSG